jgi:uncharacterized membrane protein (UPF0127 family)
MLIVTRGTIKTKYHLKIKIAQSLGSQTKGLMFLPKSKFDFGLVFPFKQTNRYLNSIHMFFVHFQICAVFLDGTKKVVDKTVLKPYCPLYIPKKNCTYLIELPKEFDKKIKTNDKINWN